VKNEQVDDDDLIRFANELILRDIRIPIITDKLNTPLFVQVLEDHLVTSKANNQLLLPDLRQKNQTIGVFSDYGGEAADSKYLTYSFLFAGYNRLGFCYEEIRNLRTKHKLIEPYKEIAFKSLDYGPISRCLDEWLYMADFIPGLLFTLIINKKVLTVFGKNEKTTLLQISNSLKEYGFGDWKPAVAEKLERILHIMCYWIAVLSANGQKLLWMSDDDSIVANADKQENMRKLFGSIFARYASDKTYAHIGFATPFDEKKLEFPLEDLLSIPDLIAGGIESYFTKTAQSENPLVKDGANKILMWLAHQGIGLKKLSMSIEHKEGDLIQTGIVEFKLKEPASQMKYVPVFM